MAINIAALQLSKAAHNGSRKRRFSLDAARRTWYAQYRSVRFALRASNSNSQD